MPGYRSNRLLSATWALSNGVVYQTTDETVREVLDPGFFPKNDLKRGTIVIVDAADGAALAMVRSITETGVPILEMFKFRGPGGRPAHDKET